MLVDVVLGDVLLGEVVSTPAPLVAPVVALSTPLFMVELLAPWFMLELSAPWFMLMLSALGAVIDVSDRWLMLSEVELVGAWLFDWLLLGACCVVALSTPWLIVSPLEVTGWP